MRIGTLSSTLLRLLPLAAACAFAGEPALRINLLNEYSRPVPGLPEQPNWALVGAPSLVPERPEGTCCRTLPRATREDSLSHIGIQIEATRGFTAEIRVYSNLGQFVDKVAFTVPQSQFGRLAQGTRHDTRVLSVLWDNRTESGALAGTGAYVLKTRVTLNALPGDRDVGTLTRIDYRIVALLRTL